MLAVSVRAAAGIALLCVASSVAAANVISDGVYHASPNAAAPLGITPDLASPNNPLGGGLIEGDILFLAPNSGPISIDVTGLGPVGDVFEVILDGVSLGITSPVAVGGPDNSTGSFIESVSAGPHDLGVWDFVQTFAGDNSPYGGAVVFDPANPPEVEVSILTVPEPSTSTLLALGMFVIGLARKRGRLLA